MTQPVAFPGVATPAKHPPKELVNHTHVVNLSQLGFEKASLVRQNLVGAVLSAPGTDEQWSTVRRHLALKTLQMLSCRVENACPDPTQRNLAT